MPVKTVASACSDLIAVYKNKSMVLCGWQRAKCINNNICVAFVALFHY